MRGTVHWNFRERLKATSGSNFQINPRVTTRLWSNFLPHVLALRYLKSFGSFAYKMPSIEYKIRSQMYKYEAPPPNLDLRMTSPSFVIYAEFKQKSSERQRRERATCHEVQLHSVACARDFPICQESSPPNCLRTRRQRDSMYIYLALKLFLCACVSLLLEYILIPRGVSVRLCRY